MTTRREAEKRTVDVPVDLVAALDGASLLAAFDAMPYTHRKEWIEAIGDAKRPETREKRIRSCVDAMRDRAAASRQKKTGRR